MNTDKKSKGWFTIGLIIFNLKWKKRIQQMMDVLPWNLAEEISPPHPPFDKRQVKEFTKMMSPVVERSVRKAKIKLVASVTTLGLGLAALSWLWICSFPCGLGIAHS